MVARELEKAGVPKERMIIEAMGERFASTEAAADDQAFERCVEIRFESRHFARQQLSRCRWWCRAARSSGNTCAPAEFFDPARHERTDHRFHERRSTARPRHPPPTGCSPAIPRQTITNYFADPTQQFLAGTLVEHARQVAHPLLASPSSAASRAGRVALENLAGRALGIRSRRRASWCRQASKAPGKSSRTAPSSTPSSRRALKSCNALTH